MTRRGPRGLWWNLFTSGTFDRHSDRIEVFYKFLIINAICVVGVVFMGGFGAYDTARGIQPLGWVITGIAGLVAANFVFLRLTQNYRVAGAVNVGVVFFTFSFLLATGGSGNTGPLWFYNFPLVALFLLGLKRGTLATLLLLGVSAITLYVPDVPWLVTTYSDDFRLRFIPTVLGTFALSALFENIRSVTSGQLQAKNRELEETIEELRRTEQALAAEKDRLAVMLRSIADGVIATDVEDKVLMMNPAAELLTGCPAGAATGRPVKEVLRLQDAEGSGELVPQGPPGGWTENDARLVSPDGRERHVALSGAAIRESDDRVVGSILVFRDITEHVRFEEELRKRKTLESVGLLAGGLAHDFNNILSGILTNVQLASRRAARGEAIGRHLGDVERALDRATGLTRQLLTFSKGGAPVTEMLHLEELIGSTATFALSGSTVRAEVRVEPDLWPVSADGGQLSQVVSNLVINAQQALPAGGTVEIRARNLQLGDGEMPPLEAGPFVEMVVADSGSGIEAQHLEKVFDPYFTTKEEGSGLGLAVCYSVVRQHDGHVCIHSRPGEGTRVHVYLPASPGAAVTAGDPAQEPHGGKGRILLMDDEEIIRSSLSEILTEFGYQVTSTAEGAEAVRVYGEQLRQGAPFDAVIMDLTIPGGLGGVEALGALRRMDPSVRAVVASGYSNDPVMSAFQEYGFLGRLPKPFRIADLSRVLAEVLGTREPDASRAVPS